MAWALLSPSLQAQEPPPKPAAPFDARSARLFFAPTARTLPRGQGVFGVTELVFPWAEVGIFDRLSFEAIGVPPLEGLSSAGLVLGPKLQLLRRDRVQAAAGVFQALGREGSGGLAYGVVTVGSGRAGLTVGVGRGYGGLVELEGSPVVVFVGGDALLGKGLRVLAEVYLGGEGLGLPEQTLTTGLRWSRGRFSLDCGLVLPVYESSSGVPFPVLTLGWAF